MGSSSTTEGGGSNTGGMIATLALQVIGGMLFGPVGAVVGGLIGNAVFNKPPTIKNEGSRTTNLKMQGSEYGVTIQEIRGTARVPGQMFWATDIKETKNVEKKKIGKGGQKVENTTYVYTANAAFLICRNEVAGMPRVWANSGLFYDITDTNNGATGGISTPIMGPDGTIYGQNISIITGKTTVTTMSLYYGRDDQPVDGWIEHFEGVGKYSAHQGYCYVIFKNFGLEKFNNGFPNLNFEIVASDNPYAYVLDKDTLSTENTSMAQVQAMGYNERDNYLYVLADGRYIHKVNTDAGVDAVIVDTFDAGEDPPSGSISLGGNTKTLNFTQFGNIVVSYARGIAIIDTKTMALGAFYDYPITYPEPDPYAEEQVILLFPPYPYPEGSTRNGDRLFFDTKLRQYFNVVHYSDGGLVYHLFNEEFGPDGWDFVQVDYVEDYTYGFSNPYFDKYAFDSATGDLWSIRSKTSGGGPGEFWIIQINRNLARTKIELIELIKTDTLLLSLDDMYFDDNTRILFVKYRKAGSSQGGPAWLMRYNVDTKEVIDDVEIKIPGIAITNTPVKLVRSSHSKFFFLVRNSTQKYIIYYDLATAEFTWTGVLETGVWGTNNLSGTAVNQALSTITNTEYYLGGASGSSFVLLKNLGVRFSKGKYDLKKYLTEICARVDIDESDLVFEGLDEEEIRGYYVNNETSARGTIEQLSYIHNFSGIESDFKLKFRKNGNLSFKTILDKDLGTQNYAEDINFEDALVTTRKPSDTLPNVVSLTYPNQDFDYEVDTQEARMINIRSENSVSSTMPVILNATEARQIATRALYSQHTTVDDYTFTLNYNFIDLEPLDVITLNYEGATANVKLLKVEKSGGMIKVYGVSEDPTVYDQSHVVGVGSTKPVQRIEVLSNSEGIFLDIPAVRNDDLEDAGFYAAGYPNNPSFTWPGAQLFSSTTPNDNFNDVEIFEGRPRNGRITSVPDNFVQGNTIDVYNSIEVLMANELQLLSCTEEELLNGQNLCIVGNELIQFQNAELLSPKKYKLTTLLRGRFNTEEYIANHAVGEVFVLLDSGGTVLNIPMDNSSLGQKRYYKMITYGQYVSDTDPTAFTNNGVRLQAYKVFNLISSRDNLGTIRFNFNKSVRGIATSLAATTDVYDIDGDNYQVDIYSNNTYANLLRTITLTATNGQYSTTDQISDFAANQSVVYVKIYKMNKFGIRGKEFKGTI